jgi:hypothetical protein
VSLFFFHSSCLFFKDTFGDRSHHTWSFIVMKWMDDTMLTSSIEAYQGDMVCTRNLIMKAWKEFSQGSQQFDKTQCKDKKHMSIRFFNYNIIWLW